MTIDVEQVLADLLSQEIDKELKVAGLPTRVDRDQDIINELIKLAQEKKNENE